MNTANHTEVAALDWSDAFLLGFGPMDKVHEEFVGIVGALQRAGDEELAALMDALASHAKAHFDAEDAWMVDTDFPARDCHMGEHAAVLRSINEVRDLLAAGNRETVRRLAAELAKWFPGHADYLDSALSHWMCKRQHGGKPVVLRRSLGVRALRSA